MSSVKGPLPKFFTLSSELRNMIYGYVLLSPTRIICPMSRREAYKAKRLKSLSGSAPRWLLVISDGAGETVPGTAGYISLSLPRTCRQIYDETQAFFWANNTFYFRSPLRLLEAFKPSGMGRIANQYIRSIRLDPGWPCGNFIETLTLAVQVLIKQQSASNLQRLDLVLSLDYVLELLQFRGLVTAGFGQRRYVKYGNLLPAMKLLAKESTFARGIRVFPDDRRMGANQALVDSIRKLLLRLHSEWGGQTYFGEEIVLGNDEVIKTAACSQVMNGVVTPGKASSARA